MPSGICVCVPKMFTVCISVSVNSLCQAVTLRTTYIGELSVESCKSKLEVFCDLRDTCWGCNVFVMYKCFFFLNCKDTTYVFLTMLLMCRVVWMLWICVLSAVYCKWKVIPSIYWGRHEEWLSVLTMKAAVCVRLCNIRGFLMPTHLFKKWKCCHETESKKTKTNGSDLLCVLFLSFEIAAHGLTCKQPSRSSNKTWNINMK